MKNEIYAARDKARAALTEKENEWDSSDKTRDFYDENIETYDARIKELEELISLYY